MKKVFLIAIAFSYFLSSCSINGTAYIEIKNSAGRDIAIELYANMPDESNLVPRGTKPEIAIKKDRTVTEKIVFSVVRGDLDPNKHIALKVTEKGDYRSLAGYRINNNTTQKVEVVSRLKICPESKLAGKWVYKVNDELDCYFIFNAENNKGEIFWGKSNWYIAEWYYKENKLFYREWRTGLVVVGSKTEDDFKSYICNIYDNKIEISYEGSPEKIYTYNRE